MGDVDEKFKLSFQGFSSCFCLGKKDQDDQKTLQ